VVLFIAFRFDQLRHKLWAFGMMQWAHRSLRHVPGLQFYKLMGSGAGDGFRPSADFSIYSMLTVWQSEADADRFLAQSSLALAYQRRSVECWRLFLRPMRVKGKWDGMNPFGAGDPQCPGQAVAVLTRATIDWRRLRKFWRAVPPVSHSLHQQPHNLVSFGIGEWPLVQMATFSLWKNAHALQQYAYHSEAHRAAIQATHEVGWFKEEMYARFRPFRSEGTWAGETYDLLADKG
jgi:hypothetical protein